LRKAENNILTAVEVLLQARDSYLLAFIYAFFRKCAEKGFFVVVINYFLTKILKTKRLDDGEELLQLFLGLDMCINWIQADSEAFLGTINELDNKSRKMVLFKTEIEEYYEKHYLKYEWQMRKLVREISSDAAQTNDTLNMNPKELFAFRNEPYVERVMIGIPGKKWLETRYSYCSEHTKLVLPGICANCRKEEPFIIDIFQFFKCLVYSKGPYPNDSISGNCSRCGKMYSTGCKIPRLPFYTNEHDIYCVAVDRDVKR
jgi:hypothetical protein